MATVKLRFSSTLSPSDLTKSTLTIVGLPDNLAKLKYDEIKIKFEPHVSEEVFNTALKTVQANKEPCPLYLSRATLVPLPTKCSRTNTSSRAHAITKSIKSSDIDQSIVIVCDKRDVFASSLAVARAFPQYSRKTDSEKREATVTTEFVLTDGSLDDEDCVMLDNAAESVRLAARIVDAPCNDMNTDHFLNEIRQVANQLGIEPLIVRDKQLEERGFGGIYGVGKAAANPPALAVLSHTPQGATKTVAWVGKGIVYDTGGLSIKGKTAMPGMKRDCGGAAGVLGAFRLAVLAGFEHNLHAVFCLAENSVGPLATRPDDIHTLYSGKTVEINNTDAEGRLVLADGVFYAHNDLKADIILDMATLTGAQGIATGKYHAAVLTNSESWERASTRAGLSSGDLTFPVPFCPEFHFPEFSSAVADMKNSVADRSNALASCAGLFILAQLGFDYPGVWIHVDMAAPVHSGERATGYGVGLLVSLFGRFSRSRYLQSIAPSLTADDEEPISGNKRLRTD